MTKTVFISRDLDEDSAFAALLRAAGWQVHGLSLVTLTPLPVDVIPAADWIFFASKNAVRFFFEAGSVSRNPTPDPSPKGEGSRGADEVSSTSPLPFRGGVGGGVSPDEPQSSNKKAAVYSTDITQWKYLKSFAREMRKQSTESENIMWQMLRGNRMEGLKFRRQHAIDDYIVDFVNLDLRLIVEIDGSIHDIQPEYDKLRTEWLTVLGYKVIRFSNEEVLRNLTIVQQKLRDEIKRLREDVSSGPRNPTPDPSPKGEGRRSADEVSSTSPLSFRGGVGGGVSPAGGGVCWAALGPATAHALLRYTHRVDFTGTGDPATTAAVFKPLAQGKKVLFPAARHSQKSVPELLGDAISALHLAVYDNAPLPDPPALNEAVLVFTSPMNARAYLANHGLNTHQKVVAIGRSTAAELAVWGVTEALVSEEPTESALAATVLTLGQ